MAHRGWRDFRCQKFLFLEEHDALGGLEKVGTMLIRQDTAIPFPVN